MENQKDVESKLATYKQALEDTIKQLTQKRTELGALARQTVENLETSIPALRKTVEDLESQIANLNITILQRNHEIAKERDTHKSHYESLEKSLKEDHAKRQQGLDNIESNHRSKNEHYSKSLADLELRELHLKNGNATIEALRQTFNQQVKSFEEHQKVETENLRILNEDALKIKQIAQSEEKIWKFKNKDLANRFEELESKIKDADATIAKISEANAILNISEKKEADNNKRQAELNQFQIKLLADIKTNNIRRDALDEREADLNQRDSNLKIAESSMVKG